MGKNIISDQLRLQIQIPSMYPGLLKPACVKTDGDSSRVVPSRRSKAARPESPLSGFEEVTCNPSASASFAIPFNATANISHEICVVPTIHSVRIRFITAKQPLLKHI